MVACSLEKPRRLKKGKKLPRPPYELDWVNFHTFCHTYATWMRRYGGLDTKDLIDTGRLLALPAAGVDQVLGRASSRPPATRTR